MHMHHAYMYKALLTVFAYHISIAAYTFCFFIHGKMALLPQYREVAAAIVQHPYWKQMMRMSLTEETKKNTMILTPMRMLIESMPGTIKE